MTLSLRTGVERVAAVAPVVPFASLADDRMMACSSASFGSVLGLRPAACSKSRIAESVVDAIVVAAARQFALDIVDDLAGRTGRGRRGGLGRRRWSRHLQRPRTRG